MMTRQMSVDVKRGEKLPIHINMTFPALPCDGAFQETLVAAPYFLLSFIVSFHDSEIWRCMGFGGAVLSMDAIDMSGKHEVDLDTNIWKVSCLLRSCTPSTLPFWSNMFLYPCPMPYVCMSFVRSWSTETAGIVWMQLRLHKDGYILGSEYISDLVEGEHKEDKEHTSDVQKPNEVPGKLFLFL